MEKFSEEFKKNLFVNTNKVILTPLKAGNSTTIRWDYNLIEKDMIEEVRGTCSCSTPSFNDKQVEVIYKDGNNPKDIPENTGVLQVEKLIIVYLKDGKPLKVTNSRGVETFNPDKSQVPLTFKITIVP